MKVYKTPRAIFFDNLGVRTSHPGREFESEKGKQITRLPLDGNVRFDLEPCEGFEPLQGFQATDGLFNRAV